MADVSRRPANGVCGNLPLSGARDVFLTVCDGFFTDRPKNAVTIFTRIPE
jgi:hypothetical protein